MSYREEQLSNVDDYGYPLAPAVSWQRRKRIIHTSRSIVGKIIYLLMSIIGGFLWLGRRGKRYPPLTPATFHPRRILVIRLDLIGDLVLSLTVVRALKRTYPEAEIDLLALPASARVASYDPNLSEIITYDPNIWRRPKALLQPKNWREAISLRRRLRGRHYDLAVSVYANWAAVLAVLSGAPRRVGYGREGYPGFMTDSLPGGIPGRWRHWAPWTTNTKSITAWRSRTRPAQRSLLKIASRASTSMKRRARRPSNCCSSMACNRISH